MFASQEQSTRVPLVIDLDHTLIQTDSFHEALVRFCWEYPFQIWRLFGWACKGKARMKHEVFTRVGLDFQVVPVHDVVVRLCEMAHQEGRDVVFATATPTICLDSLVGRFSWITKVVGSTPQVNLVGHAKASALVSLYGEGGFDFVSDHRRDLPVWHVCRKGWVLHSRLPSWAEPLGVVLIPTQRNQISALIRLLRPKHWVKNLALIYPLLMAHCFFSWDSWRLIGLAVMAFSMVASAIYILNDLADLEHDRQHREKKKRPMASGSVTLPVALTLAVFLLGLGFSVGFGLSASFGGALFLYVAIYILYQARVKKMLILDIFMLTAFYEIRIFSGGFVSGVPLSNWLLAFSFFTFLTLGTLKRFAELQGQEYANDSKLKGRDYEDKDKPVLLAFGAAYATASIGVLGMYIESPNAYKLYTNVMPLWGIMAVYTAWIMYVWIKTNRGDFVEDPIALIYSDRFTLISAFVVILLFWMSI